MLIHSWGHQGAKSYGLCDALKNLFWQSTRLNSHLNLYYISSACNPADSPSRVLSLLDSKLSKSAWGRIQSSFGPHYPSADLMALPSNVHVSLGSSPLPFFLHTLLPIRLGLMFLPCGPQFFLILCFLPYNPSFSGVLFPSRIRCPTLH